MDRRVKLIVGIGLIWLFCLALSPAQLHWTGPGNPTDARSRTMFPGGVQQNIVGGGVADYCTGKLIGNDTHYYDCDHSSGELVACETGGSETGTNNAATITNEIADHTTGTGKCVKLTAINQNITFDRDSKFTSAEGGVTVWFYPTATGTAYILWECTKTPAQDQIHIVVVSATNKVRASHEGQNAGAQTTDSLGTINANAWNVVAARWSVALTSFDISLNGEAWQHDADALTAFAAENDTWCIGEKDSTQTQGGTVYIDDVKTTSVF